MAKDYTLESCREFVKVLASDAPAPGGGGASALVAAIGTALGNMVGSLTLGKKKYADVEELIKATMAKCDALQTELLWIKVVDRADDLRLLRRGKDSANLADLHAGILKALSVFEHKAFLAQQGDLIVASVQDHQQSHQHQHRHQPGRDAPND